MTWEMFEVWSVDEDGHEELVDTTRSEKEAKKLGEKALQDGAVKVIIYREVDDELEEYDQIYPK